MAPAWDEMALVGRVARAHGNRGAVIIDPATDFPEERYKAGQGLFVRREIVVEELTIATVRFHRGRPIVVFEGVSTMDAAEALAGLELRVAAEALQPLPPGAFYHHDLVGCDVETSEGVALGTVVRVEGAGGGSRLVVHGRRGNEILIPLADEICIAVHLAGRKIVVRPLEGLLDLNVTRRQRFEPI